MYTLYWGFKKKTYLLFYWFMVIKRILKALFSFIPWLLNSPDLPSYGLKFEEKIHAKAIFNVSREKQSLISGIKNNARFIQKLILGFKNYVRNLENFRQAVKSPKSCNTMGHFCPKNIFLQLKLYMQKIYVTLLSTKCVKIHQISYVIFKTISHFSRNNSSVFFFSNITYVRQK